MLNLALSAFVLLPFLTTGTAVRVRLVGGVSPKEGRLEVHHNGAWGTVCGHYFGFTDAAARVVCYMLGYGHVGQYLFYRYGAGSGQIWLENVQCSGTETSIGDCQHSGWGSYRCRHDNDISVSCITVRLVAGHPNPQEGRLEVYHNGIWGTVCRNRFTPAAARVVCRMRGYKDTGQYIGNRHGAGSGQIWLDNVRCSGTETDIADCQHSDWSNHTCSHDEDVSVSCFNEVRLVGNSRSKGRLEVYHNGTWGTVCDNGFSDTAARVVCYSLGQGRTGRVIGNAFGASSGPIWLNNVRCPYREPHITECPHDGWGRHNCSHSDDVSVSCIADSTEAVALVGGGSRRVGRLEVFHANQWGTVCDQGFTDAAARVVCYSLGFGYVGRKVNISVHDVGDGRIWLDDVKCNGTEQHIGECSHGEWGVSSCTHREDVAVSCTDKMPALTESVSTTLVTPVRLVGGSGSRGRLEVLHNGVWGTVCNHAFNTAEASVVCRMLGIESGTKIDNRNYRTDRGPIWLDDVRCTGMERDITNCSHNGWGVHDCDHRKDVAVSCSRIEVRLNGGRSSREGRLEVFYNGTWAQVCDGLNYAAALVVCNMLGFGYIGRPTSVTTVGYQYGRVRRLIWLDSIRCTTGTEETIAECDHGDWRTYCLRDYEQGVSCLPDDAVALFGGGSPREGRLEVYHNGIWGTVCRSNDAATTVVCHSLGYKYNGKKTNISIYGVGAGQIWLADIRCSGTERHISECSHMEWGVHDCGHDEDVAVSCDAASSKSDTFTSPNAAQIITVVCTVGGLLFVVCIVVIVACKFCRTAMPSCRKPQQENVAISTHPTISTNRQNTYYEFAVHYENLGANMQAVNLQQPSAPDAGAVGSEDIYHEQSAKVSYEPVSTYQQARLPYDNLVRN